MIFFWRQQCPSIIYWYPRRVKVKNFIESYVTAILLTLVVMIMVTLVSLESSIVAAREVHSECWNTVETSELNSEEDVVRLENQLNEAVKARHSGWNISIETLRTGNERDHYLVTLDYTITVPLLKIQTNSRIQSYAQ